MLVDKFHSYNRLGDGTNRWALLTEVFDLAAPMSLNLEWVLDAVERETWSGLWW